MKSLWHPGYQPPPYSHNLTSAWPVMLIANQRLPDGNQILALIMSLSKSILGKRKLLSTFRWRFLKEIFNCFFLCVWWNIARWSCRTFILQLQIIKNLLVKARCLRSVPKAGKKSRCSTTLHELKVLWKRRSLRIILRFLKEELQSNQVKIPVPFMNWLFEKRTRLSLL